MPNRLDITNLDRRHRYRSEVERLLEQIRGLVRELSKLEASGVRGRELEERKRDLERARWRLADVVGGQPRGGYGAAA